MPTTQQIYAQTAALSGGGVLSATAVYLPQSATVVGSNSAAGTSVTIPAHQVGDLFLLGAFRDGSTAAINNPSAGGTVPYWWEMGGSTLSSGYINWWIARATATNHTSGTFLNPTGLSIVVLRDAAGPFAEYNPTTGSGNTLTYAGGAPDTTDGTGRIIRFGGHRTATDLTTNTPAGYTQLSGVATEIRALTNIDPLTAALTADTQVVNASSGWGTFTIEVGGATSTPFTEAFTTLPTGWKAQGIVIGAGSVSINAGRLSLDCTDNSSTYQLHFKKTNGIVLGDGKAVSFKVVSDGVGSRTMIGGIKAPVLTSNQAQIFDIGGVWVEISGTSATARWQQNSNVDQAAGGTRTHAANTWYRIRRSGSTIFWEYSTNGTTWNAWTSASLTAAAWTGFPILEGEWVSGTKSSILFDDFVYA